MIQSKTALITGGNSGLGLATAQAFSQHGNRVIVIARNRSKFEENFPDSSNREVQFLGADLSNMSEIKRVFGEVKNRFGKIDVAVNNAGTGMLKGFCEYSEAEVDAQLNLNLKGVWLSMKYQIELMLNSDEGDKHIVNVSSVNGLGGLAGGAWYAATKAALLALSKSAAMEYAQSQLSIHALVPGPFDTPMLQAALDTQSGGNPERRDQVEQAFKNFIPKGRFGKPEEFAETILWLCSGKVPYLSGHSLILDGGLSSRFR